MRESRTSIICLLMLLLSCSSFSQNTLPVAVNDEVFPLFDGFVTFHDTVLYINVLENDYDPDGDDLEISEVINRQGQGFLEVSFTDSLIIVGVNTQYSYEMAVEYRIRKVNDTSSVSNVASLIINPGYDPEFPVARNDTVVITAGSTVSVNVLENDYHPLGDSMFIGPSGSVGDSNLIITSDIYNDRDNRRVSYFLSDTVQWFERIDRGLLYVQYLNYEWYDSLTINNINARFNSFGNIFWDMDSEPHFKVPASHNISSLFSHSLWIAGLDENNELHAAAERYRQLGHDFWPGPVSESYDSLYDGKWNHIWKLSREEIEYHKANWWTAGYEPSRDILSWPGNGDTELEQSEKIAPFEDRNENGIYEPLIGDAPIIKGDQALFYVFNDDKDIHTESEGIPLGVEIRAMAYGFDQPDDSALWNTIFLQYDIANMSDTSYHDVYLGVYTDTDLGYAWDDYIECDVERGMYFTYNDNEDYGEYGYGEHPPAQGILFLGGPYLEEDGIDNPKYDALGNQIVDESINGLNFGDGIVDNERLGMQHFCYFNSGGSIIWNDPYIAGDYYDRMQMIWGDGSHMIYGGNAHVVAGGVGPECEFMWPRDSDPYNWGTNGIWPNGGYNQNGFYWTEEQVGNNPSDRRGLGTSGPFSLESGQTVSVDLAFPWARDYEGTAWSSALLLKERASYIKELFQNNKEFFMTDPELPALKEKVKIFPNPASDKLKIVLPEYKGEGLIKIYNSHGFLIYTKNVIAKDNIDLSIAHWRTGLYFVNLIFEDGIQSTTLIKL